MCKGRCFPAGDRSCDRLLDSRGACVRVEGADRKCPPEAMTPSYTASTAAQMSGRFARRVTRVRAAFPGLGTVINVVAVVIGALIGMAIGHRLPERTRSVVTDCLGLVTLLVAGLSCVSVTDPSLASAVGPGAPVLIVLGSLLIGSVVGSLLRIEERLSGLAG